MHDFFRDNLTSTAVTKIVGGWDMHTKNYVLSIQTASSYNTLSFDESVQGWTSLLTYKPSLAFSLSSTFFTTNTGKLYQHYGSANYCNFYGVVSDSTVTVVLNAQPSMVKVFQTINYEGSIDWTVSSLSASSGDLGQVPISKYILPTSLNDFSNELFTNSFKRKENKYFANILNDSPATAGEVVFGNNMTGIKGFFSTVKFSLSNANKSKKRNYSQYHLKLSNHHIN